MPAFLPIILAGSYLVLAAERIPQLDTDQSCHAAASAAVSINGKEDICKRDERDARGKLEQQWGRFRPRSGAVRGGRARRLPRYVELLTCLEMASAAKKLPPADKLTGGVPK